MDTNKEFILRKIKEIIDELSYEENKMLVQMNCFGLMAEAVEYAEQNHLDLNTREGASAMNQYILNYVYRNANEFYKDSTGESLLKEKLKIKNLEDE